MRLNFLILFLSILCIGVVSADAVVLKLPFEKGNDFIVTRGYNAPPTHRDGSKDQYALDFTQNGCEAYGKEALAAMGGEVILAIQNGYNGGYGTTVMIDNGNDLVERYAHMIPGSLSVSQGQFIRTGEIVGKIGRSGNVDGYSCPEHPGTHLHFAIYQKQTDGTLLAYKPEPMSGYTNFLAGNWYVSDNQVYDPNHVYAQQGEGQNVPTPNQSWWQIVLGAVADTWDNVVNGVIDFFINDIPPPAINSLENNPSSSSTSTMVAQIISQNQTIGLQPGEEKRIIIDVKNVGSDVWRPSQQFSLNVFNQTAKDLYHSSWSTRLRPAILLSPIDPGQTARFSFTILAPINPGNYTAIWQLVYIPDGKNFIRLGNDLAVLSLAITKSEIIADNQALAEAPLQIDQNQSVITPLTEQQNDNTGSSVIIIVGGGSNGGGGNGAPQDTIPPETTLITDNLSSITNNSNITFQFSSDEDGSHFECQLNNQGWQSCNSPRDYTNLTEGQNNFQVRAIDTSNNVDPTPAEFTWIVDQTPPSQVANLQFSFDQDKLILSLSWGAALDNLSNIDSYDVDWAVDEQSYTTSTQDAFFDLIVIPEHNYSFKIRATDKAQNEGDWLTQDYQPEMSLHGWLRRKSLIIDNNQSQNDLIDLPINILLDHELEMNNDFSDVRFVDSDQQTLLSFGWDIDNNGVEDKQNGVKANAVIKIPKLVAREKKTIYLYYDNQAAPPISDLAGTISWYDHFTSPRTDYETQWIGWNLSDTGFIKTNFVGFIDLDAWAYLKSSPMIKDIDISFRVLAERDYRGGDTIDLMRWRWIDDNNYFGMRGYFTSWDPGDLQFVKVVNGQTTVLYTSPGVFSIDPDPQWATINVQSLGDQHRIVLNNQEPVIIQDSDLNQSGKVIYMSLFKTYNALDQFWADWFYVRQITDNPPDVYFEK